MDLDEINPAYIHPSGDDESPETPDDEKRYEENVFDRMWRSFTGEVMVNWFDRDTRHFSFWFLLSGRIYRLPITRGLTIGVYRLVRGSRLEREMSPVIDWQMVWAEGGVLCVRATFTDKLVSLFSAPSLENLRVVVDRTGNVSKIPRTVGRARMSDEPPRKIACRVVSSGHAQSL